MSVGFDDLVVLFKSVSEAENDEDDAYFNTFRSVNFQVILIPVLDFEFINLDKVLIKLRNPDDYEGIIFTSPRCVAGIELSVKNGKELSILEKWQNHKHFVVGEKTAQMLKNLRFVSEGREAGNAKNLAEIISRGQYDKPFLYPKGSLTKDSFKSSLKESNIEVDDILIYQTKPHEKLEAHIKNMKSCILKKKVYFIYFSPSGVNFSLPILRKYGYDLNQIKFIAIGPTTKESLKENGLLVSATSVKPDPQTLLHTVLTYENTKIENTMKIP